GRNAGWRQSPRFISSSNFGSTGPPTRFAPVVSDAPPPKRSQAGDAISLSAIIRKLVGAENVAGAVSNAALIAWQFPCRGSITQSPGNLPASRNSLATGTLSRPEASFSTMTTAKRRSVRWLASDSSVSRRCCGRRKHGMQTTIPTERSSERDVAASSREECGTVSVTPTTGKFVDIWPMVRFELWLRYVDEELQAISKLPCVC